MFCREIKWIIATFRETLSQIMINFVVSTKPQSYNARKKEAYTTNLQREFQNQNLGHIKYPLAEKLYGLIYYFFNTDLGLDCDNISKPIWDALNVLVYDDDRQVITRTANSINMNIHDIRLIDFTGVDGETITAITSSILANEHTIYVECGLVNEKFWKFNLESLCK